MLVEAPTTSCPVLPAAYSTGQVSRPGEQNQSVLTEGVLKHLLEMGYAGLQNGDPTATTSPGPDPCRVHTCPGQLPTSARTISTEYTECL